jgi:hypothetical protein
MSFCSFRRAYNETAGLRPTRARRSSRGDPNELSGIHTDVALSPEREPALILEDLMNPTTREPESKHAVSHCAVLVKRERSITSARVPIEIGSEFPYRRTSIRIDSRSFDSRFDNEIHRESTSFSDRTQSQRGVGGGRGGGIYAVRQGESNQVSSST